MKRIKLFFYIGGSLLVSVLMLACDKPEQAENWVPPQNFKAELASGQKLFADKCARCHGRGGMGSQSGPPLMHKIYEPGHHGDMAFYMAARNGVKAHHWQFGDMPPIPGLNGEDMGHIVAYVRHEQEKKGIR